MNHFLLDFVSVVREKMTVVLMALALLGLIGSASIFLQPTPAGHAASPISIGIDGQVAFLVHTQSIRPAASQAQSITSTQATGTATTTSTTSQPTSITGMIYQVFGPYGAGAVRVATCESGLNPGAYNPNSIGGSHPAGLFQILYPSTWAGTPEAASSPYDAWANIQAAHAIFVRDGYSWREWSCQP